MLYVEDDDLNWEVTEYALRNKYYIQRAKDARETFMALQGSSFDIILMDIQLCGSDLSGIDITKILKNRFSGSIPSYATNVVCADVPVIFVTAYGEQYPMDELEAAGGEALVAKPVDFVRLTAAISRAIVRNSIE